jgi:hypothetical protein
VRAAPLRDGDIIFHTSRSAQSAVIQRGACQDARALRHAGSLDEPVISPEAQFDSPLLETVETR